MTSDEPLTLRALAARIDAIEKRDIEADLLHQSLLHQDGSTAQAVDKLTTTINDPHAGLIVELDRFRREVAADRESFRAWVRGAVAVLSAMFALFTVIAPWIRAFLESAFSVRTP